MNKISNNIRDISNDNNNSIENEISKSFSLINYDDLKCLSLDSIEKENIEEISDNININELNEKLKRHKEKLNNIKLNKSNNNERNVKGKREKCYLLREIKINENKVIPIVYSINNSYVGNKYYTLISLPNKYRKESQIILNEENKEEYRKHSNIRVISNPFYNTNSISNLHNDYFPNPPC